MNQQKRLIELGKLIRARRLHIGMTQQQLGAESGYDATYISMLERGRRNPPFLTLCTVSRHLGVPLHKLLKAFTDE
jgi:transcriptional regulator with XRE-family HTH domain